ncbi:hypothetical protein B0H11DRAFT_1996118 [Mycena galericulata]|nr:hypothetical protein B0H11DRAFT_1996118 [Mycena galericulata]
MQRLLIWYRSKENALMPNGLGSLRHQHSKSKSAGHKLSANAEANGPDAVEADAAADVTTGDADFVVTTAAALEATTAGSDATTGVGFATAEEVVFFPPKRDGMWNPPLVDVTAGSTGFGAVSAAGGSSATTGGLAATTGGFSATTGGFAATTGGSAATTGGFAATTGGFAATTGFFAAMGAAATEELFFPPNKERASRSTTSREV